MSNPSALPDDSYRPAELHSEFEKQNLAQNTHRRSLVDGVIALGARSESSQSDSQLSEFLSEPDWRKKLAIWLGDDSIRRLGLAQTKLLHQLDRDLALIDRLIEDQLAVILHHPVFQRLEGAWRGLQHLVSCIDDFPDASMQLKVWNATWTELRDDVDGTDFDQSQFFKKIYEEGLGTSGATPFSALLLDFSLHPRPSRDHPVDDISILQKMSETAAAAFAPLFINADPSMFSVDEFSELRQSMDIELLHSKLDFVRWQRFRETEESRFVSVVMPRMLMRRPYRPESYHHFGFKFEENPKKLNEQLWSGAVWGIGEVLLRNFAESRWFATIRGVERGEVGAGLVLGPACDEFTTEPGKLASKPITDVVITDMFERQLAKLGFTALCASKYGPQAAFYSTPSIQKPKKYFSAEANANAELSALTNYILCAARFGHYVKVIARDQIGGTLEAEDIRSRLNDWLMDYVNRDPEASPRQRAERPLLDASVEVRPIPGRPGEYGCAIQLEPYHSFDDVKATLKLDTRLVNRNIKS
ncbi:MAG: type VI secretion system contractile sheath large subunit [Pirellula sp.]